MLNAATVRVIWSSVSQVLQVAVEMALLRLAAEDEAQGT